MASVSCALTFEMELVRDACGEIVRVHQALTHRRGERPRRLERRIEEVLAAPLTWPKPIALESGRWIVEPPVELKALIAEARALGV